MDNHQKLDIELTAASSIIKSSLQYGMRFPDLTMRDQPLIETMLTNAASNEDGWIQDDIQAQEMIKERSKELLLECGKKYITASENDKIDFFMLLLRHSRPAGFRYVNFENRSLVESLEDLFKRLSSTWSEVDSDVNELHKQKAKKIAEEYIDQNRYELTKTPINPLESGGILHMPTDSYNIVPEDEMPKKDTTSVVKQFKRIMTRQS